MNVLQWDVEGIGRRLADLHVLMLYHNPSIVSLQETYLRSFQSLNCVCFTAFRYDHLDGDKANDRTAALIKDNISSTAVTRWSSYKPLQASAVRLILTSLSFPL